MKKTILISSMIFAFNSIFAKVEFMDLDLNKEDRLLFSAQNNMKGNPEYKSLFVTKLGKKGTETNPKLITCFPEQMELLDCDGQTLQIRSRYGSARYDFAKDKLEWKSLATKIPVEYSHLSPMKTSPDGKWTTYVRQKKNAHGQLILQDSKTGQESVLVESIPFSYKNVHVKWAEDSKALVYEKDGEIFFITPETAMKNIQLPESCRRIGKGTIASVNWTRDKSLVYIDGDIIYIIRENELYTRGLYSSLVGTGTIAGRLPETFNSSCDNFWCDADASKLIVISKNNIASYYEIKKHSYEYVSINTIVPLTGISGTPLSYDVFWSSSQEPILWIELLSYEGDKKICRVFSISSDGKLVPKLDVKNSISPILSPDKRHVIFSSPSQLYVYDTTTWKQVAKLSGEKTICALWKNNSAIIAGGEKSIRLWNLSELQLASSSLEKSKANFEKLAQIKVITLSSSNEPFWSNEKVISKCNDEYFEFNDSKNTWTKITSTQEIKENFRKEKNGRFRVFTSEARNNSYTNAVYARSLTQGVLTYPIFEETETKTPQKKKVSIVVDALDDSSGLAQILNTLKEYKIKSTFFINGEFIRRYPLETKQIANSENNYASMFYSSSDLLSNNFVIDEEFIKRGLARNEDEFFSATGKELSLLWHPPYYRHNPQIVQASKNAGYNILEKTINFSYPNNFSSSETIDKITSSLHDGAVICIGAGKADKNDGLENKLDLLITSILDAGYEIVDLKNLK